jgi:tRNA threonylcarbamoyladenosine biosynthesis protein TsaB
MSILFDGLGKGPSLSNQAGQIDKPVILSLDTSSRRTSMALSLGERLLAMFGAELDHRRSERLWYELEFLLNEAGVELKDIDLFSACTGPGGFTGLRVGLAAIKGFARAGGKKVAGVTSLEALACAPDISGPVLVTVNAHKGEFYAQLFDSRSRGLPVARTEPSLASIEEVVASVIHIEGLTLIGDGAEAAWERSGPIGPLKGWQVRSQPHFLAGRMARAALLKYARGDFVGASDLRAFYSRPADAEVKLSQGLVGKGLR